MDYDELVAENRLLRELVAEAFNPELPVLVSPRQTYTTTPEEQDWNLRMGARLKAIRKSKGLGLRRLQPLSMAVANHSIDRWEKGRPLSTFTLWHLMNEVYAEPIEKAFPAPLSADLQSGVVLVERREDSDVAVSFHRQQYVCLGCSLGHRAPDVPFADASAILSHLVKHRRSFEAVPLDAVRTILEHQGTS